MCFERRVMYVWQHGYIGDYPIAYRVNTRCLEAPKPLMDRHGHYFGPIEVRRVKPTTIDLTQSINGRRTPEEVAELILTTIKQIMREEIGTLTYDLALQLEAASHKNAFRYLNDPSDVFGGR